MRTPVFIPVFLLIATSLTAQDDSDLGPPLTKARAESYVDCLRDLMELGEEYEDYEGPVLEDLEENDFAGAIAAMRGHPYYEDVMDALEEHGFDGPDEWAQTSSRFLRAYSALKMEEREVEMDEGFREAIDQIEQSAMLTDEQKKQMVDALRAQHGMLQQMEDAPSGDKDAVKSVMEAFEELAEES